MARVASDLDRKFSLPQSPTLTTSGSPNDPYVSGGDLLDTNPAPYGTPGLTGSIGGGSPPGSYLTESQKQLVGIAQGSTGVSTLTSSSLFKIGAIIAAGFFLMRYWGK